MQQHTRKNKANLYDGKPCRKCGGTLRYEIGNACFACKRAYGKKFNKRPDVREKLRDYQRQPHLKEYQRAYRQAHKERLAKYFSTHDKKRDKTPERQRQHRNRRLIRQYGISLEEYDRILAEQSHGCAICSKPPKEAYAKVLHVDHCHTTNAIRGLLCDNCNHLLGNAKDNVSILIRAIEYLNKV
jgi:hypothetical protein